MNGKVQVLATVLGFVLVLGFGLLMWAGVVGQWVGFAAVALGAAIIFPARVAQAVKGIAGLLPFGKDK